MERNDELEVDKILSEAGVDDIDMSPEQKKELVKTLRQSHEDYYGGTSVSKSQEPGKSMSKEEKLYVLNELKSGCALGKKVVDLNPPNHGNTSLPLREKEVSKELPGDACYSAAVARAPSEKQNIRVVHKTTFKSAPGGPVSVRTLERDTKSSHQENDSVWLEATNNKENNSFPKKVAPQSKEDTNPEEATSRETESSSTKDNVNNVLGESKGRESPENLELPGLNALVFHNRTPSSFSSEFAFLPPVSGLSKEEWVRAACQNLFARKLAQLEKTRLSRWVTLSERTINISSLENAVAKSPPKHSKEFGSNNSPDSSQSSVKARSSPEHTVNDVQDRSPDVVVVEGSPEREREPADTESRDNAATALPESAIKEGKVETPPNSPAGRSEDYGGGDGDTNRRKITKSRNRKGRGARQSTTCDDNSNGAPSSYGIAKHNNRDHTASNSSYSPTGGNSPADVEDKQLSCAQCPMCQRGFNDFADLEAHAWVCDGPTAEGENQVAENGGRSDATEPKRRKLFSRVDDDMELEIVNKMNSVFSRKSDRDGDHLIGIQSPKNPRKRDNDDDDVEDFVPKRTRPRTRKKNLPVISSDDEGTTSKCPRK